MDSDFWEAIFKHHKFPESVIYLALSLGLLVLPDVLAGMGVPLRNWVENSVLVLGTLFSGFFALDIILRVAIPVWNAFRGGMRRAEEEKREYGEKTEKEHKEEHEIEHAPEKDS